MHTYDRINVMENKLELLHEGKRIKIDFVTSDQHIGHINISRLANRPFNNSQSTDSMDTALLAYWNSMIDNHHNVLNLGDIAMGNIETSLQKWTTAKGNKFLVPGNHDRVSSVYSPKHRARFIPIYEEHGFTILPEIVNLIATINNKEIPIRASHYPHEGDSQHKSRYDNLRPIFQGPLLHGHTHSNSALTIDPTRESAKYEFHVGVDAFNFTPVPAQAILEWVERLPVAQ